jgi:hypothetical protein
MLKVKFLPGAEIQYEEQFSFSLESIVKIDNKRMLGVWKDISLSFSISDQVLPHYPLFAEDFHCIEFVCFLFLNQVYVSKAAATKNLDWNEIVWSDFLILKGLFLRDHFLGNYRLLCLDDYLVLTMLEGRYLSNL